MQQDTVIVNRPSRPGAAAGGRNEASASPSRESPTRRARAIVIRGFSGASNPVRDSETAREIMYRAQLASWWTLQPDLQHIFHPGGNIADPNDPRGTRPIRDAIILGARTAITF
jgi:porin